MACANCGQSHAIGMACGKKPVGADKAVNTAKVPKGTDTPKTGLKPVRQPPRIK